VIQGADQLVDVDVFFGTSNQFDEFSQGTKNVALAAAVGKPIATTVAVPRTRQAGSRWSLAISKDSNYRPARLDAYSHAAMGLLVTI
jgi:hypothetical protein